MKLVSNMWTNCWGEGNCANVRVVIRQCSWDSRTSRYVNQLLLNLMLHVLFLLDTLHNKRILYFSRNGPSSMHTVHACKHVYTIGRWRQRPGKCSLGSLSYLLHADRGKLIALPMKSTWLQEQGPNKEMPIIMKIVCLLSPFGKMLKGSKPMDKMTQMNLNFVLCQNQYFFSQYIVEVLRRFADMSFIYWL